VSGLSGPGASAADGVRLGLWPTPLQAADAAAGIYVKREDLCGFAFGGSKVRALEPVLAEARGRGARSIVTGGRRDSNWAALAAAAATRLGLRCHCVLDPGPTETLAMALARRTGATLHMAPRPGKEAVNAMISSIAHDLGPSAYAVPRAGATAGGVAGYRGLARELIEQMPSAAFDVVVAVGSGGAAVGAFCDTARRLALAHAGSWWADLTYWQPAQVSSFGHYLLSFGHEASRHLDRIRQAWTRCALVPVAVGGVAGTTVPLSREATLRRLGLEGPATTSRDAMWSVDGLIDIMHAARQAVLTVSRLAEDFLLFASTPFGYVRLHDSHCRASVYLPQKRNPYALTVVRGGYAVVAGRSDGVAAAMGTGSAQTDNWIYSYGETLATLGLARQLVQLMAEVLGKATFDTARMAALALDGFTEAADLAERLVTEEHIDYRTAHSRVARLAAEAERRGGTRLADGTDPRTLVLARTGEGSAAPAVVRASARRLRILLARHRAWRRGAQARADAAIGQLVGQARAASAVQPGPHITPIPEALP
jgi:argininosuccinate lyase